MKSWGYDIHSFEAFNMNFGYFVHDLVETQGGVKSFSDQIWCLDFKKDLFYLTWAKGDLNTEKIYAKK